MSWRLPNAPICHTHTQSWRWFEQVEYWRKHLTRQHLLVPDAIQLTAPSNIMLKMRSSPLTSSGVSLELYSLSFNFSYNAVFLSCCQRRPSAFHKLLNLSACLLIVIGLYEDSLNIAAPFLCMLTCGLAVTCAGVCKCWLDDVVY